MGVIGPSRAERLAAAANALQPFGFTLDRRYAAGLRRYEPFVLLPRPCDYAVGAVGRIDGMLVEAYEYDYDADETTNSELVVALHHPAIEGGAAFQPEDKAWFTDVAWLDAICWVPPLTLLKVAQLVMASRDPDRVVGDAEFDRLYWVTATSDEVAQRAIPPALRETLVRLRFRGKVELRPGVILYTPFNHRLDGEKAVPAIALGAAMLSAYTSCAAPGIR